MKKIYRKTVISVASTVLILFQLFFISYNSNASPLSETILNYTFYQKLENFTLFFTPEEICYLLDNLEYTSYLLNYYKIHTIKIKAISKNTFEANDKNKLTGTFSLIRESKGYRIYKGKGEIKSKLIGQISADVVTIFEYKKLDKYRIINNLEFWVKINNKFAATLCNFKLFHPILVKILNKKLYSLIDVAQSLSNLINHDLLNVNISLKDQCKY
ncbi:MAG: hypothetical protein ACTSUG_06320 [Candidatus Helarchaeota archaeon]